MSEAQQFLGTGRRKRATARVRLSPGSGEITVNGRPVREYFVTEQTRKDALAPLRTIAQEENWNVEARIAGGGISGQAGALSLGISRALQKQDAELRAPLKKEGLLKRDPREKERKKTGQPGARKKFQFSKR